MTSLIDMYMKYYSMLTDGDPIFGKFSIIQLIGWLLSKNSFINTTPEVEYLNLYTMFVGDSYTGRKNVAQTLIKYFYPYSKILPNESSSEKFVENLSENPDGVWMMGEFSRFLKHMKKGSYLSEFAELFNDIYSYPANTSYKREILSQDISIYNPYPILNTTITPTVLQKYIEPESFEGGLFGRLILIFNNKHKIKGRQKIPKEVFKLKKEILTLVDIIYKSKMSFEMIPTDDAFEYLTTTETDLILNSNVSAISGRYCQAALKISGILAFNEELDKVISKVSKVSKINNISKISKGDTLVSVCRAHFFTNLPQNEGIQQKDISVESQIKEISNVSNDISKLKLSIKKTHIQQAFDLIKPCIKFAESQYEYSCMNKKYIIKVRDYIFENYPVPRSKVMQYCNIDNMELDGTEKTLGPSGQEKIRILHYKKEGCRSKTIYCITTKNKKCSTCMYKESCDNDT